MDTALGKRFPDLVVMNANLVNVYTREIQENVAISVCGERIAFVGSSNEFQEGPDTRIIDAAGRFVIPGFIEGHTHLAWLAPPAAFLEYAAVGGTTTVITETLEVYFVAGRAGVEDFLAALEGQPVKCLATAPAMGSINSELLGLPLDDLRSFLDRGDIVGLGESYWQTVVQNPDRFLPGFEQTLMAGKTLEGHSAGTRGRKLAAYSSLGISSCHEPIDADQVAERLRNGIHVMIREGSIRSDLKAISAILDRGLDLRYLCLVSDGVVPQGLIRDGYMETIVQKAINAGFEPLDAIRMASLNVAEHFHLDGHIGGIAPGRYADMLLVDDIRAIEPSMVIGSGSIIAENGHLTAAIRTHEFLPESRETICLDRPVNPSDFNVAVTDHASPVQVRALEMVTDLVTREQILSLEIKDNRIAPAPDRDLLTISAIDRRMHPGRQFNGLISGYGLKQGAFACSGAWDTADIIAIGADNQDLAMAVNRIHELRGGIVVCSRGNILAELALPCYGLFADADMKTLAQKLSAITAAVQGLGCPFPDPLLTLQTLTGAAIPWFRICSQGLVDFKKGEPVELVVPAEKG